MPRHPHYSKVTEAPDVLNPVTGRSLYYGSRPWRCADRMYDLFAGVLALDSPSEVRALFGLVRKCAATDFETQPTDDYRHLEFVNVMYYVERRDCGMLRERAWDLYPYFQLDVLRVRQEDGLKMRVWRHQRELELKAREGKVDELILASVARNTKRSPSS